MFSASRRNNGLLVPLEKFWLYAPIFFLFPCVAISVDLPHFTLLPTLPPCFPGMQGGRVESNVKWEARPPDLL